MCRSTNRRSSVVQPEVYFRLVRTNPLSMSTSSICCEQTIEITLGPKGAPESVDISTWTGRTPTDHALCSIRPPRGKRKPPKQPKTPRVTELLRKAIKWHGDLEAGKVSNQAEIARREGLTRARVTQIMSLLRLAPEIQEHVLEMPETVHRSVVTERALRLITHIKSAREQLSQYGKLLSLDRN